MEEKTKNSSIKLENRKKCDIDGIIKLDSFDDKEFLVDTNLGFLHIKGKNLSLGTMNMDEGTLTILGDIDSFTYINKINDKEKSFLKKLFK